MEGFVSSEITTIGIRAVDPRTVIGGDGPILKRDGTIDMVATFDLMLNIVADIKSDLTRMQRRLATPLSGVAAQVGQKYNEEVTIKDEEQVFKNRPELDLKLMGKIVREEAGGDETQEQITQGVLEWKVHQVFDEIPVTKMEKQEGNSLNFSNFDPFLELKEEKMNENRSKTLDHMESFHLAPNSISFQFIASKNYTTSSVVLYKRAYAEWREEPPGCLEYFYKIHSLETFNLKGLMPLNSGIMLFLLFQEMGFSGKETDRVPDDNSDTRLLPFKFIRSRIQFLQSVRTCAATLSRLVANWQNILAIEKIDRVLTLIVNKVDLKRKIEWLYNLEGSQYLVGSVREVKLLANFGVLKKNFVCVLKATNLTKATRLRSLEEMKGMFSFLQRFGGVKLFLHGVVALNYDFDTQLIPKIGFISELDGDDKITVEELVTKDAIRDNVEMGILFYHMSYSPCGMGQEHFIIGCGNGIDHVRIVSNDDSLVLDSSPSTYMLCWNALDFLLDKSSYLCSVGNVAFSKRSNICIFSHGIATEFSENLELWRCYMKVFLLATSLNATYCSNVINIMQEEAVQYGILAENFCEAGKYDHVTHSLNLQRCFGNTSQVAVADPFLKMIIESWEPSDLQNFSGGSTSFFHSSSWHNFLPNDLGHDYGLVGRFNEHLKYKLMMVVGAQLHADKIFADICGEIAKPHRMMIDGGTRYMVISIWYVISMLDLFLLYMSRGDTTL